VLVVTTLDNSRTFSDTYTFASVVKPQPPSIKSKSTTPVVSETGVTRANAESPLIDVNRTVSPTLNRLDPVTTSTDVSDPITLDNTSQTWRYSLSESGIGLAGKIRKIKLIKELIIQQQVQQSFVGYWGEIDFEEVAINALFDSYNQEKHNYYYRQGANINLVAERSVDSVAVIYYRLPDVAVSTFSSWIADMYPYVIYERAAASIFQMTGKTDEFAIYNAKSAENRFDIIKAEIGAI